MKKSVILALALVNPSLVQSQSYLDQMVDQSQQRLDDAANRSGLPCAWFWQQSGGNVAALPTRCRGGFEGGQTGQPNNSDVDSRTGMSFGVWREMCEGAGGQLVGSGGSWECRLPAKVINEDDLPATSACRAYAEYVNSALNGRMVTQELSNIKAKTCFNSAPNSALAQSLSCGAGKYWLYFYDERRCM